jgi:hypothetical protein
LARIVDQNPPHHLSRDPEKMRSVLPMNILLIDQLHESFIDERGGL